LYDTSRKRKLTHETSGEGLVGPDLSVHLDDSLLDNSSDLLTGQSVLQSVSEEDSKGKRLSKLVGTGRRSGCLNPLVQFYPDKSSLILPTHVGTAELVQHP
jgi:hypothetical protein